jgi:dihydropteroate synthase
MGILNVTPDSFSDGGKFMDPARALRCARRMQKLGADIIDVGGESTRPGADHVSPQKEIDRVCPVIESLSGLISIDTTKAAVASAALASGAKIVNDVSALGDPRMGKVVSQAGASIILMHRKGRAKTMQKRPRYRDVVDEILSFLQTRVKRALSAGIPHDRIMVDPGIGFGKKPEHNLEILTRLEEFHSLGLPVVIGTSRKSFLGHYLDRTVEKRLFGTAATVAVAVLRGAQIVRVHDVAEMRDVAFMSNLLRS